LVQEAAVVAEQMGAKVTVVHLSDYPMPFYDADLEQKEGMPKNAKRLRQLMIESDAVIIASPEYNHSISGVLKNALDWISRGEDGDSSFAASKGKVFALMSASPGRKGGKKALVHLRDIIEDLKGTIIEEQVSISHAYKYFGEKEREENPSIKKAIQQVLATCKKRLLSTSATGLEELDLPFVFDRFFACLEGAEVSSLPCFRVNRARINAVCTCF